MPRPGRALSERAPNTGRMNGEFRSCPGMPAPVSLTRSATGIRVLRENRHASRFLDWK